MGKYNDRQARQRLQLLLRYRQALDVGDLATIAAVLRLAEDDPVLDAMLLEVDNLSAAQDGVTVPVEQLQMTHNFLSSLRVGTQEATRYEILTTSKSPLTPVPNEHGTFGEGRVQSRWQELLPPPPNAGASRRTPSRSIRFSWAAGFMRSAAAVLVVGAIVAGFVLVLSPHSGMQHQTTQTSAETSTPHGIYFSRSDTVYRLDIQTHQVIWQRRVPGLFSHYGRGFVVIGDIVYVVMDPTGSTGTISAIDADTGTVRWTHTFPGPVQAPVAGDGRVYVEVYPPTTSAGGGVAVDAVNSANGTVTATYTQFFFPPTVAGGYLYGMSNSSASVVALQLPQGKIAWQQQIAAKQFTSGPIVVQNGVAYVQVYTYYYSDSLHTGFIEALDAHTGAKLWQSPEIAGGYRVASFTRNMIYIATNSKELLALDTHTHAVVWRKSFDTFSMQVDTGRLYIQSSTNPSANPQVVALDASTGEVLWQKPSMDGGQLLVGVQNGVVYGVGWPTAGQEGIIFALNAATGKQLWTLQTPAFFELGGMVVA
jgi:outer membrane protein assembly factor BamB